MLEATRERVSAAVGEADMESEALQAARRRGYQEGLIAVGVPYLDAVRRASERYP